MVTAAGIFSSWHKKAWNRLVTVLAANEETTPAVEYGYADGSANHVRPTHVTYPNGCEHRT